MLNDAPISKINIRILNLHFHSLFPVIYCFFKHSTFSTEWFSRPESAMFQVNLKEPLCESDISLNNVCCCLILCLLALVFVMFSWSFLFFKFDLASFKIPSALERVCRFGFQLVEIVWTEFLSKRDFIMLSQSPSSFLSPPLSGCWQVLIRPITSCSWQSTGKHCSSSLNFGRAGINHAALQSTLKSLLLGACETFGEPSYWKEVCSRDQQNLIHFTHQIKQLLHGMMQGCFIMVLNLVVTGFNVITMLV